MGRITNILRLILMRKKLKKKLRRIKVWSEDGNKLDEKGGPYTVEIPKNDDDT